MLSKVSTLASILGIWESLPVAAVVVEELGVKEAPLLETPEPPMTPPLDVIDASLAGALPMSLSLKELGRPFPFDPKGSVPDTAEKVSGLRSSDGLDACPCVRDPFCCDECVAADEVDKDS